MKAGHVTVPSTICWTTQRMSAAALLLKESASYSSLNNSNKRGSFEKFEDNPQKVSFFIIFSTGTFIEWNFYIELFTCQISSHSHSRSTESYLLETFTSSPQNTLYAMFTTKRRQTYINGLVSNAYLVVFYTNI